jgi:hypothetical protein
MKKIMYALVLSCKKATQLIEKKAIVKLSMKENIQLHLHKSMCSACTEYEKQSKKIDRLLHDYIGNDPAENNSLEEDESLKQKIIHHIQ